MKYSNRWLEELIASGEKPEYIFFYGHHPKEEGVVDKSCFSQFYPAPFTVGDGGERNIFLTAEHFMMYYKALAHKDEKTAQEVLDAKTPAEAKFLGRMIEHYDDKMWSELRYSVVFQGNVHKFRSHHMLKKFLLSTGKAVLVEASESDKVWGIGLSVNQKSHLDPKAWKGTNLLGYALMEVRDFLTP